LNDPYNVPVIERATLELARECDLNVQQTDLVKLDGREVMLVYMNPNPKRPAAPIFHTA
jgi:serine/threonine-protein kinase HipA